MKDCVDYWRAMPSSGVDFKCLWAINIRSMLRNCRYVDCYDKYVMSSYEIEVVWCYAPIPSKLF